MHRERFSNNNFLHSKLRKTVMSNKQVCLYRTKQDVKVWYIRGQKSSRNLSGLTKQEVYHSISGHTIRCFGQDFPSL
jgi:hypothetical protein